MAQTDREALVALYNAAGGPTWKKNKNWNTDADLSEWHNITTNDQGRVVGLVLDFNNLRVQIPPQLGDVSSLESLDLRWNKLNGHIPPQLGDLGALQYLKLSGNELDGPIPPELGGLGELEILWLQNNELEEPIPEELGKLTAVKELRLNGNKLSGPIPPELGNLAALQYLELEGNKLSGPIPKELGALGRLGKLRLYSNNLTGPIPRELGNLAALQSLDLSVNTLSGSIPPELGKLGALQRLILWSNKLTGPIPEELGKLTALQGLYLSNNNLSGHIPRQLGDVGALVTLDLSNNKLEGSVPAQLLKLNYLEVLVMYGNKFSGPVPSVEQLRNLRRALDSSGDQHQGPEQTGRVEITPHDDTVANKVEDASSVQSGMTTTTAWMTATTSRSRGERRKFRNLKHNDKVEGNDHDAVIGSRISAISDFEGDVVAWSFGDRAEVLRPPGFEFELDVRRLGRNVPALISLCSSSAEVVHGKQCLLHPVLTCLAGAAEEFDPPLRLRFPVGDVDSMVSGSDCGSHDDAEVAYRAHLESTFSALTREDAKSEWVPIDGAIVQIEGGVFVLELTLSHFCGFALCQNVMVDAGCVKLVPVPKLKHESRQSHYNFVNLGTQHLVVHLWGGAARKRGFLESFRVKLGLGPTSGEAEVEGRRTLVDVPSTGVKTVTVPRAHVGGRGTPVCRPVYDGVEPLTVVWTTQEQKSHRITGSTYELVQVWGDTSMTYKHALVFGPLLEGARPRISNLNVADSRFVGTRVKVEMERTGGGDG